MEIIQLLREAGGKLSLHPVDIGIAVCLAISKNDFQSVEAWHISGADFSEADYHGRTPLHAAVSSRNLEMIKFLCTRGANPSAADSFGRSPIDDAMLAERKDIIEILAEYVNKKGEEIHQRATFVIGGNEA